MKLLRRIVDFLRRPGWLGWSFAISIIVGTVAAQVAPCTSCWGVNP